ncbi:FAD-dependent oxidoreductase [Sphingomonas cannabina]|uniref:flavin monoamine oxidase family protein n=1 Tax=Sphingomonas cannabina TaxID=2899123 RepID=UPI001F2D50EB|nr:FAD-dependent oxidoreductase [Sphingomonas cannabina]UIJ44112.1 FAD-dependent oxidoreductase [Sphingomonas cannabina]
MSAVDVAIVGAGAAGIGAARRVAASGRSALLVEAGSRIGGRAWTLPVEGMPLDLGCGWLHSAERNPWVRIAEEAGFAVTRGPTAWGKQYRDLGFTQAERDAAGAAYAAFEQRLRDDPPASDRAFDALPPGGEWNDFIESLSGYINGAGLRTLSIADYLAYDGAASDQNWRLPAGYGTLVAASLPRLPVAMATPVTHIDHAGRLLRLETSRGAIEARTAIVTVPTNVIANGALSFSPALGDHVEAAARLPLGLANKIFLHLDGAEEIDPDSHLLGNPRDPATGSYYLRPFGRPVIECFFGGEGAKEIEATGLDGAASFAAAELSTLFGSGFARRLRLVAGSAWGQADGFGGSYSHACPGHAGARAVLARPVDNRLFFAGEACSPTDFSTAHGALATGIAAAEAALAVLD